VTRQPVSPCSRVLGGRAARIPVAQPVQAAAVCAPLIPAFGPRGHPEPDGGREPHRGNAPMSASRASPAWRWLRSRAGLPAPISLTPAEKAAIPPTAWRSGSCALLRGPGPRLRPHPRPRTTLFGYAVVVMAIPFLSGNLLVAVGEDRSSAAVASATAAALERSGGSGVVLASSPTRRRCFLPRPPHRCRYRDGSRAHQQLHRRQRGAVPLPSGSPLLPAGYWREALARCPWPRCS